MANMWLERVTTVVVLLGTLAGGWLYVDDHYAKAADVRDLKQELKQDNLDLRKRQIEDKLFELEFKRRESPAQFKPLDGALLDRYNRELKDLREKEKILVR